MDGGWNAESDSLLPLLSDWELKNLEALITNLDNLSGNSKTTGVKLAQALVWVTPDI